MRSGQPNAANDVVVKEFVDLLIQFREQYEACISKADALSQLAKPTVYETMAGLLQFSSSSTSDKNGKPTDSTPLIALSKKPEPRQDEKSLAKKVDALFTEYRRNELKKVIDHIKRFVDTYQTEAQTRFHANTQLSELTKRNKAKFQRDAKTLQQTMDECKLKVECNIKFFKRAVQSRAQIEKYNTELQKNVEQVVRDVEDFDKRAQDFCDKNKERSDLVKLIEHVPFEAMSLDQLPVIKFDNIEKMIGLILGDKWINEWNKSEVPGFVNPRQQEAIDEMHRRFEQRSSDIKRQYSIIKATNWEVLINELNAIKEKMNRHEEGMIFFAKEIFNKTKNMLEAYLKVDKDKRKVTLDEIRKYFDQAVRALEPEVAREAALRKEFETFVTNSPDQFPVMESDDTQIEQIENCKRLLNKYKTLESFLQGELPEWVSRHNSFARISLTNLITHVLDKMIVTLLSDKQLEDKQLEIVKRNITHLKIAFDKGFENESTIRRNAQKLIDEDEQCGNYRALDELRENNNDLQMLYATNEVRSSSGEVVNIVTLSEIKSFVGQIQNVVLKQERTIQSEWEAALKMSEGENLYAVDQSAKRRTIFKEEITSIHSSLIDAGLWQVNEDGDPRYVELAGLYNALVTLAVNLTKKAKAIIGGKITENYITDFEKTMEASVAHSRAEMNEMIARILIPLSPDFLAASEWSDQLKACDPQGSFVEQVENMMRNDRRFRDSKEKRGVITNCLLNVAYSMDAPLDVGFDDNGKKVILVNEETGKSLNNIKNKWLDGLLNDYLSDYHVYQEVCRKRWRYVDEGREWADKLSKQLYRRKLVAIVELYTTRERVRNRLPTFNLRADRFRQRLKEVERVWENQFSVKEAAEIIGQMSTITLRDLEEYDKSNDDYKKMVRERCNQFYFPGAELERKLNQAEHEMIDWSLYEKFLWLNNDAHSCKYWMNTLVDDVKSQSAFLQTAPASEGEAMALQEVKRRKDLFDSSVAEVDKSITALSADVIRSANVVFAYEGEAEKIVNQYRQGDGKNISSLISEFLSDVDNLNKNVIKLADKHKKIIDDLNSSVIAKTNSQEIISRLINDLNMDMSLSTLSNNESLTLYNYEADVVSKVINPLEAQIETMQKAEFDLSSINTDVDILERAKTRLVANKQARVNVLQAQARRLFSLSNGQDKVDIAAVAEKLKQVQGHVSEVQCYQAAVTKENELLVMMQDVDSDKKTFIEQSKRRIDEIVSTIKLARGNLQGVLNTLMDFTKKHEQKLPFQSYFTDIYESLILLDSAIDKLGEHFEIGYLSRCLLEQTLALEDTINEIRHDHKDFARDLNKLLFAIRIWRHQRLQENQLWKLYHLHMLQLFNAEKQVIELHHTLVSLPAIELPERLSDFENRINLLNGWLGKYAQPFIKSHEELMKVDEEIQKIEGSLKPLLDKQMSLNNVIEPVQTKKKNALEKLENDRKEVTTANESFTSERDKVTGIVFRRFKAAFFNDKQVKESLVRLEKRAEVNANNTDKPNTTTAIRELLDNLRESDSDLNKFSLLLSQPLVHYQLSTKDGKFTKLTKRKNDQAKTKTCELINNLDDAMKRLIKAHNDIVYLDDVVADFKERKKLIDEYADVDPALCDDSHFNYHYRTLRDQINKTETKSRVEIKNDLLTQMDAINTSSENGSQKIIKLKKAVHDALQKVESSFGGKPNLFNKGSDLHPVLSGYLMILDRVTFNTEVKLGSS